jgi:hypothetical protein
MDKVGEWVRPNDMVDGAGKGLQFVHSGLAYASSSRPAGNGSGSGALLLGSLDAPLVRWGEPLPFPTPLRGSVSTAEGPSFVLHDNAWNTNFLFWWPFAGGAETAADGVHANMLFRFDMQLPCAV